jgi:large subunit ribosomal protein L3
MKQLVGRKIGMSRLYDDTGLEIPVTVIEVQPHVVIGLRTADRNGYDAIIVGLEDDTRSRTPRQIAGQFPEGVSPKRIIRELQTESTFNVGDSFTAAIFSPGEKVKVAGKTRGRGFAGVVRRHHFRGGPNTHGSMSHRMPGSVGASAYPSRVIKGTLGGGRMGNASNTVKGLRIVEVDPERNLLLVSGSVPGSRGGLVTISSDERK